MPKTLSLLYHEVIDDYSESGFQNKDNLAYMHKREVFERHVEIFKRNIQSNSLIDNYLLTFDDGGKSNLKSAQILEKNDLKGIYFITTNKINSIGFLSSEEVLQLYQSGHVVGSHSHTHPMIFRSLSYSEMLEEWRVSKDILENIVGKTIEYCSIPGGDADAKTYESAAEVGFKFIFDSEPIIEERFVHNAKIFGRFSIKAQTTDAGLVDLLNLNSLKKLQRNRKIKSTIKKIIFPIHQYIQNKKNG